MIDTIVVVMAWIAEEERMILVTASADWFLAVMTILSHIISSASSYTWILYHAHQYKDGNGCEPQQQRLR